MTSTRRVKTAAVSQQDGLLNVLKPPGMTSHDVVARVRRLLGIRRIGHTGTLDPGAAGVLVLCVGRATRLVELLQAEDKAYRAEMCLGTATDSQDAFGEPERIVPDCAVRREALDAALTSFVGEIEQIPPMTSAVKHRGRRLYELARAGVAVERKPRRIRIERLDLVRVEPDGDVLRFGSRVTFDVTCSKGTYVRTLCADIGDALGCGAFMSFLLRTRVGELTLADARTLEELERAVSAGEPVLLPVDVALSRWPRVELSDEAARRVLHGQTVPGPPAEAETFSGSDHVPRLTRLYAPDGRFIAMAEPRRRSRETLWRPRIVFS